MTNEITRKKLVFSKHWSKLDCPVFTTIRKRNHWRAGDKVEVFCKETKETFVATVLFITRERLHFLPTALLEYDTDTHSREDAVAVLQSFYRDKIAGEFFYVIMLKREDEVIQIKDYSYEEARKIILDHLQKKHNIDACDVLVKQYGIDLQLIHRVLSDLQQEKNINKGGMLNV